MILRVFPRRTNATPDDAYAFIGEPDFAKIPKNISEVHISVTFTWDLLKAEKLADQWSKVAPVRIGGPATEMRGGDFVPGFYLKTGYVVTSRGCPNHCWFCEVPRREGNIRELPIREGWNVLDSNLLACSDEHIRSVFAMLSCYKNRERIRPQFTGGLEAARLKPWHVELLKELRPKQMFFAFDTPEDLPALEEAARLFRAMEYGTRNNLRCYVLVGYRGDTIQEAEQRLRMVMRMGFCPMAMLYRNDSNTTNREWKIFQQFWARPALIYQSRYKAPMNQQIRELSR